MEIIGKHVSLLETLAHSQGFERVIKDNNDYILTFIYHNCIFSKFSQLFILQVMWKLEQILAYTK